MALSTPNGTNKIRENRLRRVAARQGFKLGKSRQRDPQALGYGTYGIYDPEHSNVLLLGNGPVRPGYGLTLDDVEQFLLGRSR
jgi:hypothetical protein